MRVAIIISTIFWLTLFFACKKEPMISGPVISNLDCAEVTYSAVIKPLFVRTCGGSDCHSAGASDGEITNYSNTKPYVNNGDIQKLVLDKREMPVGFLLTGDELAQVKCWLDGGALNN